ncbi:Rhodanese-related sulfurtransferase [Micromonospora phaseoli]|uniref:Rhodanese-related sulfurtransferase n=1 Tax=Micromonospora phaseoli TaxID=1144548 RepID=A0A1H6V6Q7_9ACTN|nr:rhodanese-like domain-containing protein [Micromonospora phaseoli]PZV93686.1 rhodanese-related sulfurtransferase [Micromonospora phaseoli]GIJ79166.1 sulfurtransferase [Micromonospora phaseoli]SEJ00211.1 Rhodanese-related sulfurtransferase [Micromonospora phaseoli]
MNPKNSSPTIDVPTARALLANNPDVLIVDVRTPGEFETAHVPASINLPLEQVDAHLGQIVNDAGGRILLMCQSGTRAAQACTSLANAGLGGATVITGGMNAWITAGAPVERGRERWSLERQVRLVAGGIVLLSVVASIWVPAARFVAGFVGAGLTFAALSNTCAMGALLSRLPYNRGAGCDVDRSLARLRNERQEA